ncbi:MAG TPA: TetR/AcrR family transcriptional regulator [Iamia sp.]|jgi:AcrR family transcriptional regulator|nr:TetR/AcrR family transcriptional regulator [Iamia sp.]
MSSSPSASSSVDASAGRPSREETRRRLLDSAYETFCEVGFQAATIEEVCARAGFTRGAFYSNFTSLDELLLALWERTVDTTTAAIREQVSTVEITDEPFETAIAALVALRAPDRAWFVISTEFLLHSLRTPGLDAQVERHRAFFRDELRRGVEALLDAEGRRPPDGIDTETFTQLLIAGHLGCQHLAVTGAADFALARSMLRALVAGCPHLDDRVDLSRS